MTYVIKSQKAGKTFTTKDPLKDAQWGNEYYGVDDCVVEVVQEMTKDQINAIERIANIKATLDEIDRKSIRAIRTNDSVRMAELEAQAEVLRQELKNVGS